ncbi:hypothetical protein EAO75_45310 [Streptomyces sp. uw30]|uniref:DUF6415 family natural product biosynthesis protein n=1 Tax=Streptomyces sp. uw30 TaxID=1828179 RepID=UPI0011CD43C9|nr:DUF6415 family natural product biosynthesis protein [Streptomyces sp. uw30]TXS35175.1 hypothetical protein EAO75_45310 [Streptomyces sp. uw30]
MRRTAARATTGPGQDQVPPDLEVMRDSARQLLDPDSVPDVRPPSRTELDALTLKLRGHVELLAPEVEEAALRLPENEVLRFCALACVGEARGKLRISASAGLSSDIAYARRIARVLNALCDHYEDLTSHKK